MKTWLVVAAERRELGGILKRFGGSFRLEWPGARFACQADWGGDRWLLIANGPGRDLVEQALQRRIEVSGMISTGFCGALDPALRVGDIVVEADSPLECDLPFVRGGIFTGDRVAVTAAEKLEDFQSTGAAAIDMETATVKRIAGEWDVPFRCVRAVSDTAGENMPLDFNLFRDAAGRFSRVRIALAAMARPFSVMPALLRFDRHCGQAAEALGEFFADCRF